ncbi:hypothetical protein [Streptomyces sp. PsTaAH-124]|uniref:hypothetical protein n=1 Tax=Streptomyces sp. PsTaAH-124 TaxID=1157638 RepID=UPI0003645EA6|nr:hypothetical protein [Streptomyces sp. PsTaAH-124]
MQMLRCTRRAADHEDDQDHEQQRLQQSPGQGPAIPRQGVAAGSESVLHRLPDLVAQKRQEIGGLGVGQVRGGDFEHQLPELVRARDQVVDDGTQRGDGRSADGSTGAGGGAVRMPRTAWRTTARTVASSRA